MASKNKPSRLESEIEKCRSSANWNKILDLSKQFGSKGSGIGTVAIFVQRECELEKYLLEHPANESNIAEARQALAEVQKQFSDISLDPHVKNDMKQDAKILLAKISYAMGDYLAAHKILQEMNLESISLQNMSIRKLQLIGEGFAIKGLCLEKLPPESTSKFKLAEREEQIIRCFEKSGDISLVQLQNRQAARGGGEGSLSVTLKAGGQWNVLDTDSASLGPLVETAIQRSPILYIRNGELAKGIGRFRDLLCAVETRAFQSLRQTLARQLAEVLLRGVSRSTYQSVSRDSSARPSNGPRPKTYAGDGMFSPREKSEETLLLLLISESIASREALLNRSGELYEDRVRTLHSATAVYDLLAIALVRHAQYSLLSETFERALKFSFDEFHVWYQFALSLICAEKYTRAYLVLKECLRLEPNNAVVLLQAAKLCYEQLGMAEEGVAHCDHALSLEEENPMQARCHVYRGVGLALLEDECRLKQQRQEYQRKALQAFKKAVELDPHDFLAFFHLARQLAVCRQISEALRHVRQALRLQPEQVQAAHLLALLLSAQQQHSDALALVTSTLEEFPDNFNLLLTRSRLEARVHGVEQALHTCKHMLVLWRKVFEPMLDNEVRGTGLINKISDDRRSLMQLHFSDYSDRDSNSLRAESMAASKIEQTLSDMASSLGSLVVRPGPQQSWSIQTQIWLHLGEMYMSLGNMDSAQACISEAAVIHPLSHNVSYMRGRLHETRGELVEARQAYENAVAINPMHANSLMHLGGVLQDLGSLRMAEKVLREGVNCSATCSGMWASLGRVLQSLGEDDTAAQCHVTAVMLSNTEPIQPFSAVPLMLQ